MIPMMSSGLQNQKRKTLGTFSASQNMSRSNSTAVKNITIDIGDILESEISVNIDIGKGDIDPALIY